MSARVFIVRRDGGEDGPYSEEEILDALEAGRLRGADWCRLAGESRVWRVAEVFVRLEGGASAGEQDAWENERPAGDEEAEEAEEADAAEDAGNGCRGREVELYRGAPSYWGYGWPLLVAGMVVVAGWWLGQFGVRWVVGGLVAGLVLVVRVLVHRGRREYVVSTERVASEVGWWSREVRELDLAGLASIRVHRSGVLGWLGVGTIFFTGGERDGGEVVVFERVGRVGRVVGLVRRCLDGEGRV